MKTRGHSWSHRVPTQSRTAVPLDPPHLCHGEHSPSLAFGLRSMYIIYTCFPSVKCQPQAHLLFIFENSLLILQLIKLFYSECCLQKACCHNGWIKKNNKGLQTLKLDSFKTVPVNNVEEKQLVSMKTDTKVVYSLLICSEFWIKF